MNPKDVLSLIPYLSTSVLIEHVRHESSGKFKSWTGNVTEQLIKYSTRARFDANGIVIVEDCLAPTDETEDNNPIASVRMSFTQAVEFANWIHSMLGKGAAE